MATADISALNLPRIDPSEVDQYLAEHWTLPASLYTDPEVAKLEDQLIWRPAWIGVGTLADFKKPGDYITVKLGGRYPILVVLDQNRQLQAFFNVCRHRGALIAAGETDRADGGLSGNCNQFQCRYHGWTYSLDGRLKGAPGWKGGELPPFEELGLQPISIDTWGGIVFVSIEPAESLAEYLSEFSELAESQNYQFRFLNEELEFSESFDFQIDANWKIYLENSVECYHCATIHPTTLVEIFDVRAEDVISNTYKNGLRMAFPFKDDLSEKFGSKLVDNFNEQIERTKVLPFDVYTIYPCTFISSGVGIGEGLYWINPTGTGTCENLGRTYLPKGEKLDREEFDQFINAFVAEDLGVSAGAQIGLESGARQYGPLLAGREENIRGFSQYVWDQLGPAFR